jgi:protein-tyrosine phosphatase
MTRIDSHPATSFEKILNFRDIGGITTGSGKKIKPGIIFRSANPDTISKKDIGKFNQLNIRTVIDLRARSEYLKRKRTLQNIDSISLPLDFQEITRNRLKPLLYKRGSENMISDVSNSLYIEMLDASLYVFRQVMETLLSPGRCPVLIHCQAGKDRTGIICALILLALGADRHLIIDDFMRSNEALLPFFKKTLLRRKILSLGLFPSERILFAVTVRQRNIESILDRIENHYGGINAYLMESGYNTNSLDELKRELLVG